MFDHNRARGPTTTKKPVMKNRDITTQAAQVSSEIYSLTVNVLEGMELSQEDAEAIAHKIQVAALDHLLTGLLEVSRAEDRAPRRPAETRTRYSHVESRLQTDKSYCE